MVEIGGRKIQGLIVIAGLCVLEDRDINDIVAREVRRVGDNLPVTAIFKASYDKANRTSINSYRGPGIERGLEILKEIRDRYMIPILTDVHSKEEAKIAGGVVDVLQIPAFLSRQTDLLISAGENGSCVNIKKGQFMAPWDVKNVVEKVRSTGNHNILITERGTVFGYNNLVVDFTSFPIMKRFGYPVIFDTTHSLQLPGGKGERSGGRSEFIPVLSRAAVAAGVDGLFLEVHPEPEKAKSDSDNALPLNKLYPLIEKITLMKSSIDRIFSLEA